MANVIDIHRHWAPPAYKYGPPLVSAVFREYELTVATALQHSPGQSPQSSDNGSCFEAPSKGKARGTGILSTSWPGAMIAPNPQDSRRLARAMNTQASEMIDEDPKASGSFAAMPCFTDIVGTVAELKHSIDTLKADGVMAFTSYGRRGLYLGHADFTGIWQQLNARGAVVFIHPCPPQGQREPLTVDDQDWPEETAKAALDLLTSGRLRENPDVKVVLAHGGGTLLARLQGSGRADLAQEARRFYFDTSGVADAAALQALLQFAPADHLLYGSAVPVAACGSGTRAWDLLQQAFAPHGGAALVLRENALRLFPRLA